MNEQERRNTFTYVGDGRGFSKLGDACFVKLLDTEELLQVLYELEVEHYHSRSIYEDLVFDWPNLFPVCRTCNGHKSNIDHKGALLKADVDDPEVFLRFNPANGELEPRLGLSAEDLHRAKASIQICALNRGTLCESRILLHRHFVLCLKQLAVEGVSADLREQWSHFLHPAARTSSWCGTSCSRPISASK